MLRSASCADAPAYSPRQRHQAAGRWNEESPSPSESTHVTDHMGVPELDSKCLRGINTCIHTGQDEILLGWWEGKMALGEARRVLL